MTRLCCVTKCTGPGLRSLLQQSTGDGGAGLPARGLSSRPAGGVSAPRAWAEPLFGVMVLLVQRGRRGDAPHVSLAFRESARVVRPHVRVRRPVALGLSIDTHGALQAGRVERWASTLQPGALGARGRQAGRSAFDADRDGVIRLNTAHPCLSKTTGPDGRGSLCRAVSRTPDRLAVVDAERVLTYRDLDARANGVAHHLHSNQIGAGHIVAVACSRSQWLVVACVGILKAGAAYLPLDPAYPPLRLAEILADSGARLLLTDRPGQAGLDVTQIPPAPFRPAARVRSDDLAYVIYTSGSTGRPKGVAVEHGAFANMALAQIASFAITPADRIAQFSAPSFDAWLYETFLALLSGASLAMVPEAAKSDARDSRVARARRPSLLVPSVIPARPRPGSAWCRAPSCNGRESANADDARHYGRSIRSSTLWSDRVRGCATLHEVGPEGSGPIPIGRPIPNTTAYVLDDLLQILPIGVPGELYLGGTGVARGYLDRPDLTAERFLPDPFTPGARLFRTGDRAVRNRDGTLHFLGRLDQQIKLRGYRIEPGEIEHCILEQPGVSHAAVIDRGGELLAYVVGPVAGLREHLLGRLPSFMVPNRFVSVERLPLTSSGKLDRRALPDPQNAPAVARAPRDQTERRLVAIFAEVLGAAPGPDDDFFLNGGHSLGRCRSSRVRRPRRGPAAASRLSLPTRLGAGRHRPFTGAVRWAPIPASLRRPTIRPPRAATLWVWHGSEEVHVARAVLSPARSIASACSVRFGRCWTSRIAPHPLRPGGAELRQRVDPVPTRPPVRGALGEAEAQTWLRE